MRVRGCRTTRRSRAWLLVLLPLALHARAGDWHLDGTLACSDCHTMHNARDGQPMRYDQSATPANRLLRAENATALCLACHGSGNPTSQAPGVRTPSNGDPPGGGFPSDLTDPSHRAHSLGATPVLPPDGDTPVVMTCVTCHAPHGNGAYRNLRASPSGTGRSLSAPTAQQTVKANGTNAAEVYVQSNVRYVSGMSAWCMDCHNNLTDAHSAGGDSPPHPWDRPMFASPESWAAWSAPVSSRVPAQNAAGLGAPVPDAGDQVFCLSCHKAHGSPNASTLIHADALTLSSTCLQCHDQ